MAVRGDQFASAELPYRASSNKIKEYTTGNGRFLYIMTYCRREICPNKDIDSSECLAA